MLWSVSSFWLFSSSHRSITVLSRPLSVQSSVDPNEVNRFRQLSSSWWNETGEYAALHSLNQLRIPFVREQLLQSSTQTNDVIKPLKGFKLLDVGCGGGILSEVCGWTRRKILFSIFFLCSHWHDWVLQYWGSTLFPKISLQLYIISNRLWNII